MYVFSFIHALSLSSTTREEEKAAASSSSSSFQLLRDELSLNKHYVMQF